MFGIARWFSRELCCFLVRSIVATMEAEHRPLLSGSDQHPQGVGKGLLQVNRRLALHYESTVP